MDKLQQFHYMWHAPNSAYTIQYSHLFLSLHNSKGRYVQNTDEKSKERKQTEAKQSNCKIWQAFFGWLKMQF